MTLIRFAGAFLFQAYPLNFQNLSSLRLRGNKLGRTKLQLCFTAALPAQRCIGRTVCRRQHKSCFTLRSPKLWKIGHFQKAGRKVSCRSSTGGLPVAIQDLTSPVEPRHPSQVEKDPNGFGNRNTSDGQVICSPFLCISTDRWTSIEEANSS